MRWYFTNRHPLEDDLRRAGETIVGTDRRQLDTFERLRDAVAAFERARSPLELLALYVMGSDPITEVLFADKGLSEGEATSSYRLRQILDSETPDVLVVTPMLQPGLGVDKGAVVRWSQAMRKPVRAVIGIGNGRTIAEAKAHRWRGCAANFQDLYGLVTPDSAIAKSSATERRTAVWSPGEAPRTVLAMANDIRAGRTYIAGRFAKPYE